MTLSDGNSIGYANLGRRLSAFLLDAALIMILAAAGLGALQSIGLSMRAMTTVFRVSSFLSPDLLVSLLVGFVYFVVFDGSAWKGTPGKRLLGLRVTTLNGRRLTWPMALWRTALAGASLLILGMPYITALATCKHQTLHDRLSRAVVLHKLSASAITPKPMNTLKGGLVQVGGIKKASGDGGVRLDALSWGLPAATSVVGLLLCSFLFISGRVPTDSRGEYSSTGFFSGGGASVRDMLQSQSLGKTAERAMDLAMPLLREITQQHRSIGRLPLTLSALNAPSAGIAGLASVTYLNTTGALKLDLRLQTKDGVRRATLLLIPNLERGLITSWGCGAAGLSGEERPKACQSNLIP